MKQEVLLNDGLLAMIEVQCMQSTGNRFSKIAGLSIVCNKHLFKTLFLVEKQIYIKQRDFSIGILHYIITQ